MNNDRALLVVYVEGGIIQCVVADRPADVMVVDYDAEGASEVELTEVVFREHNYMADVGVRSAVVDPTEAARRHMTFTMTQGKTC